MLQLGKMQGDLMRSRATVHMTAGIGMVGIGATFFLSVILPIHQPVAIVLSLMGAGCYFWLLWIWIKGFVQQ
jgi:ABC-type enterochelin transport system permease subunit